MIDSYYPPVYLLFPRSSIPPYIYLKITHLAPVGYNRHSVYLLFSHQYLLMQKQCFWTMWSHFLGT